MWPLRLAPTLRTLRKIRLPRALLPLVRDVMLLLLRIELLPTRDLVELPKPKTTRDSIALPKLMTIKASLEQLRVRQRAALAPIVLLKDRLVLPSKLPALKDKLELHRDNKLPFALPQPPQQLPPPQC